MALPRIDDLPGLDLQKSFRVDNVERRYVHLIVFEVGAGLEEKRGKRDF